MKYEKPSIKPLVTTDSPFCIDITSKHAIDVKAGSVLQDDYRTCQVCCVCVCADPCISPCDCPCSNVCHPIDSFLPKRDQSKIDQIRIWLRDDFLFRQEKFGGLLFDKRTFNTYIINSSAAQIIHSLSKGVMLDKLGPRLSKRFGVSINEMDVDLGNFLFSLNELNAITYSIGASKNGKKH